RAAGAVPLHALLDFGPARAPAPFARRSAPPREGGAFVVYPAGPHSDRWRSRRHAARDGPGGAGGADVGRPLVTGGRRGRAPAAGATVDRRTRSARIPVRSGAGLPTG